MPSWGRRSIPLMKYIVKLREREIGGRRKGDAVQEGTVRKGSSVSRGRNERKRKREKEKGIEKERRRDGGLSL